MYKELSIKLYPYSGLSDSLIEFFAIIGYEEKMLNEYFNEINTDKKLKIKLSIISTIISESFNNKVNFDDIIKKVYPDKPEIFQITKYDIVKPKNTNVIFSSCIDSINGDKKICYSCYAFRFYEKYIDENKNGYYVPKAFLFYSQYPYFTAFYNICYKLHIYNEFYFEDKIPIEVLIYCLVNYIPNPVKKCIIIQDFKPNIIIPRLSGYPYIDFDFCKIFNTIEIKEFIKIFILVFLELDILIFSPDIEKLNIFMYMLYVLNYPLTDTNYFWHIKSISKSDINKASEAMGTVFLGINSNYNKNLNLDNFRDLNFIVDIDKKKNLIKNISKSKESKELNNLLIYVDKLLKHKEKKSFFLYDCLILLKRRIKKIKKEYKLAFAKKKSDSFFYVDKNIIHLNRRIQEAFYDFILTFLTFLQNDYLYDYTSLNIIKNKDNQNKQLTEEEQLFLKYFRFTIKYNNYFVNFISYYNSFDEYKIPLLFTDEFVNLKQKKINKLLQENVKYFIIMDKIYYSKVEKYKINFNNLNKEFKLAYERNSINKNENKTKNQLFILDRDIINNFLYYKNNKDLLKSFQINENNELDIKSINIIKIPLEIQTYFYKYLKPEYFIRSSILYIFSIIFPIFSFNTNIHFLSNILLISLRKIKYFQRYYIIILLKSFNKYYLANQDICHFPELTFKNIKNYCELIQGYLIKYSILPNEEIFKFYQDLISSENNKEEKIKNDINNNDKNINKQFIYEYDKNENHINNIKADIVTKKGKNIYFNYKGENIKYNFKSYYLIFQQISCYYEDYSTRLKFNIDYINVNGIVELIINIIFYLIQLEDLDLSIFLLNAIILLKNFRLQLSTFREKNKMKDKNNNVFNGNINNIIIQDKDNDDLIINNINIQDNNDALQFDDNIILSDEEKDEINIKNINNDNNISDEEKNEINIIHINNDNNISDEEKNEINININNNYINSNNSNNNSSDSDNDNIINNIENDNK